jgi:prolipoprotein diacylglyceryltransferase
MIINYGVATIVGMIIGFVLGASLTKSSSELEKREGTE